ncbi:hypothetical protein [Halostagnicola sp. A-GB9-2]|uniref:polysaccharide deacetylase family protein n=1 Tax=Halostagnicola sp. A-GB9-2 TaxID=3048066 RepID=UPI0024C02D8F|nr:hypothetical protein [Halostagnicola sp. A-GB9-2]MDJ1431851.1 hypothetical protein [Halostagnicola sp. A-GB9-2]
MTNRNRRSFITTAAVAATAGLAGCATEVRESLPFQSDDSSDGGNDDDDSDTEEGETEADELDHLPGETVEDFDDLDDWVSLLDGGELEAATDDPYAGSQSARLTAGEEGDYAGIYSTVSGGLDLDEQNLSLAVKFTDRQQLHLTVELFAPDSNSVHSFTRTLVGPADRWVRVDLGTTGLDSHTDLSSVQEIRIAARRRGGEDGSIECEIDDLRSVSRPDRGKVLLLFDGTLESHHTEALEPMQEHDFVGVEAVIPDAVGETDRLTYGLLQDLNDAGWEMIARPQTGSQRLPDFEADEQERAIEQTKSYLESRGFDDGAEHFVVPGNILGTNTIDAIREHHEQAFRYGGSPNALPLTDPHNISVFPGTEGDVTKQYVDYAAEHSQLAVLRFEELGDDGMELEAFEDLLEHIDDQDIDVVTATELREDR